MTIVFCVIGSFMLTSKIKAGDRFGRYVAVAMDSPAVYKKSRKLRWRCQCDCGNTGVAHEYNLLRGLSKSCGCYAKKRQSECNKTHGMTNSPIYHVWQGMKKRCNDSSDKFFHRYGGRGIKVCDRWLHSFESFYEDMGERPANGTLERIDSDGDYCPENCRWATPKEQARNMSRNKLVTINGIALPMIQMCELLGVNYYRVRSRLRRGWPDDVAFSVPKMNTRRKTQWTLRA